MRRWWMSSLVASVLFTNMTLNLVACSPTPEYGTLVPFYIKTKKPQKVDTVTENEYQYDNKQYLFVYEYDKNIPATLEYQFTIARILHLISQYLRNNMEKIKIKEPKKPWEDFFASFAWKRGSFTNINYDIPGNSGDKKGFTTKLKNQQLLIEPENNDDYGNPNKLLKFYAMIPSKNPWEKNSKDFNPDENFEIPEILDDKPVSTPYYVYFYVYIGDYKLEFSVKSQFIFKKMTDKNGNSKIFLDKKSMYLIDNTLEITNNKEKLNETYKEKIINLDLSKSSQ